MSLTKVSNETEAEIAQFFQKRVRERIIYELSSKKRAEVFNKLAHTAEDYIDCRLIVEKNPRPFEPTELKKRLGKTVYVMAYNSDSDGGFAELDAALNELWSCGVPYMLYGNGLLYLETEYDFSVHMAYLLMR
ncbi:MAG: hypothetical protein K2N06_10845 [Oscillospiraceae bacterium]|nr:hypothetical protein [Oscillospiraceae bacterium]